MCEQGSVADIPTLEKLIHKLIDFGQVPGSGRVALSLPEVHYVIDRACEQLRQSCALIEFDAPVCVCGDTHGQFKDLIRIFQIFCMHGGLSPLLESFQQLRNLRLPLESPAGPGLIADLLWSDPSSVVQGYQISPRGISYNFGEDVVQAFCLKHNVDLIIRAHQVVPDGYEFFADKKLITIFSAPNYCGEFENSSGTIHIDEKLSCSIRLFFGTKMQTGKFYCCKLFIELNLCPLEKYFGPLATFSSLPVLAGDTLYPTINHHIAAQLFRDIDRLEAAKVVPGILEVKALRSYIRSITKSCDVDVLIKWREQNMFNALKIATQLKFAQYPELKALLMQTGNCLLIETHSEDLDWAIGFSRDKLESWMQEEQVSPYDLMFWTMHPDFRPGIVGANLNGKLLMNMRQEFLTESGLDFKPSSFNVSDVVFCKVCQLEGKIESTKLVADEEILNINEPNNFIAFNFPSLIFYNGQFFEHIEHFVIGQCEVCLKNKSKHLTDLNRKAEFLATCYEKGLKLAYEQNGLLREALLATENLILVEIRPEGSTICGESCYISTNLGAFNGSFGKFREYVVRNGISAKSLSLWWQFCQKLKHEVGPSYMLKAVGDNSTGQALMKLRDKLQNESFPTSHEIISDQLIDDFGSQYVKNMLTDLGKSDSVNSLHLFRIDNLILCDDLVFLSQSPSSDGQNSLSRYYLCSFTLNQIRFLSVEHYYWWTKMHQLAPKSFTDKLLHLHVNHLSNACQNWLASNTPLCDEEVEMSEAALESQILFDATYAKLRQNPSIWRFLMSNFKILVQCTDRQYHDLDSLRTENSLNGKLLMHFWLHKLNAQPALLCDNIYGLILMKIRQNFFDQYYKSYLLELEDQIDNVLIDVNCESTFTNFFIFHDSSPIKFDRFSKFVDQNVQHPSVYHYLFSKCLENLGLPRDAENLSAICDPFDCVTFAERSARMNDKFDEFQTWLKENERRLILQAFELCSQTSLNDLEGSLLSTQNAYLLYGSNNKEFGIGTDEANIRKFIRNLNLNPTSLITIMSDDNLRPQFLGHNLWAKHLSWFRDSLKQKEIAKDISDDLMSESLKAQILSINNEEEAETKRIDSKDDATASSQMEFLPNQQNCVLSWSQLMDLVNPPCQSRAVNVKLEPLTMVGKTETKSAYQSMDERSLALLAALDSCCQSATDPTSPCVFIADLLDRCQNEQQAFSLGSKLAQCFDKLFNVTQKNETCGPLEQLLLEKGGLSSEDLHNIGRIVGFESS